MYLFPPLLLFLLDTLPVAMGDYTCLCSYQVEAKVYSAPDTASPVQDYVYEFDCKPLYHVDGLDPAFEAIGSNNQLGYIEINSQTQVQECPGEIPAIDVVTTTTTISTSPVTSPLTTTVVSTSTRTTSSTVINTTKDKSTTVKDKTTTIPTQPTAPTPAPTSTTSTMSTTTTSTTTTTTPRPTTSTTITTRPTTTKTTTPRPSTTSTTTTQPTTTEKPTTLRPTTSTSTTTTTRSTTTTTTTPRPTTMKTTTSRPSTLETTTTSTTSTTQLAITTGPSTACPSSADPSDTMTSGSFCYELVRTNTSWRNSKDDCERKNGTMLVIENQTKQEFVYHMLQKLRYFSIIWLGLNDEAVEEHWKWVTGDDMVYNNWMPSRYIDSYNELEDCAVFVYERKGQWDDTYCDGIVYDEYISYPHVCQYYKTIS